MNAEKLLLFMLWGNAAAWSVAAFLTLRGVWRGRDLQTREDRFLSVDDAYTDAPLVAVLVPCRNEAGRCLRESISSILAQDYKRFIVVAVNDRSMDETGAVLNELARSDARLRVIEGAELPEGWLGKPHAMQQGFDAAKSFARQSSLRESETLPNSNELPNGNQYSSQYISQHGSQWGRAWVLATDADMIFDCRALRTAVAHGIENSYDAVTLLPHGVTDSFWGKVFTPAFAWFMLLARPLEKVNDPRRKESLGIGGFFLIKAEWLERVGAWNAVKAEVAEDLKMAEVLKSNGARLRIESAPSLISTRMHDSFQEIWENFSRNLFAGARFNLLEALAGAASVLLMSVVPPFVFLMWTLLATIGAVEISWKFYLPLLVMWTLHVSMFAVVYKRLGMSVKYAVTAPLGHLLFSLILINSAIRIWSGAGVKWKGRAIYTDDGAKPSRKEKGEVSSRRSKPD